jgi:hypothetical protein
MKMKKNLKKFNVDSKTRKNLEELEEFLFKYFEENVENINIPLSYSILSNLFEDEKNKNSKNILLIDENFKNKIKKKIYL